MTRTRDAVFAWLAPLLGEGSGATRSEQHLNDFDEEFRDQRLWISAAVDVMQHALAWRSTHVARVTIALKFFLKSTAKSTAFELDSRAKLEHLLSLITPPAIIAYRDGAEPNWTDTNFRRISDAGWLQKLLPVDVIGQEWYDAKDHEFERTLWLVSRHSASYWG
jgi:hypothetical protein